MRIALCDDDEDELRNIQALLRDYASRHPLPALNISPFSSAGALLEASGPEPFDLYLLDIIMPGLSGIALAERLGASARRPYVIFLTTSPDYALDAFSVQARNYLLKPISREALFPALDEAVAELDRRADIPVTISSARDRTVVVPLSSIVYAEGRDHTVSYHMKDGAVVCSRTVREPFARSVGALLESGCFIQPHQSFVVNMNEITRLSNQTIHLSGALQVPIARSRLAAVRAAYIAFLSQR